MSSACRASIGAIPPVWWCPRRRPSSTVRLLRRNSPRLVAVSLESRPRPGSPVLSDPSGERRIFGDGGFAALGALLRRVVGVSRLYWCNSPRLLAVRSRFRAVRSRFRAVRSRLGAAWRPKCRPPRRKTPTMGCRGRGGLRCGHNGAWPGVSLAREPAIAFANRLFRT